MNTNETQKTRPDEAAFIAVLVIIELIVLPLLGGNIGRYGGGVAMLATAVIGLIAYVSLFGERVRSRGQKKLVVTVFVGSLVFSAVLVLAYWLVRSHWH